MELTYKYTEVNNREKYLINKNGLNDLMKNHDRTIILYYKNGYVTLINQNENYYHELDYYKEYKSNYTTEKFLFDDDYNLILNNQKYELEEVGIII